MPLFKNADTKKYVMFLGNDITCIRPPLSTLYSEDKRKFSVFILVDNKSNTGLKEFIDIL